MSLQVETPIQANKFPRVRSAKPEDFQRIMVLCRQLYQENGATLVDWPAVEAMVMDGINGFGACLGVIGDPVQGMIFLRISKMWYSSEMILEELFVYVDPEHRIRKGVNNAKALINFAKKCSDDFGIPLLIGVISNKQTEAKIKLYKRELGPYAGTFFLYNGKTGDR